MLRFFTPVVLMLSALPLFAADWPQFMGPDRNHVSKETDWAAPKDQPNVLWRAQVGAGYSGISVADGRAYTIGWTANHETLWCFEAASGKVLWKHTYPAQLIPTFHKGGPNAAPTIQDGKVYALSKDGQLWSGNAATGEVLWKANLYEICEYKEMTRWGFASAPWIDGDAILLHSNRPVAIDKNTGKLLYTGEISKHPGYGSLAMFEHGGKKLMAAMSGDSLVIYDRTSGKTVARHAFPIEYDMHAVTPMIADEPDGSKGLFIGCANKGGRSARLRFNGAAITEVWVRESMRTFMNNPARSGDHLYGFDGKHKQRFTTLQCQNYANGATLWSAQDLGCGSLILAHEQLIVLSEDGRVLVAPVSPKAFKPTAEYRVLEGTCWTPPSLSGGLLFVRNEDGDVACLDWRKQ